MHVVAFAVALGIGAMSPGPDFAMVVRYAVGSGRRAGLATAVGVACGVFVWVLAATTGVAALLAASAVAFTVVKMVGAAYLLFIGIRALRAAAAGSPPPQSGRVVATKIAIHAYEGVAVFFVALMPQFLPSRDPAVTDVLLLSVIALAVTVLWFGTVATVLGGLRRLFDRPRIRRAIDGITGTALVLLGLRLAATRI
jgi:threonine/homoserine/homoserine lactone efflux protein